MQTFLPYADFRRSAACLDMKRLGKQRVEARQILNALTNPSYGWQHHPAVRMWRGHADALAVYMNCCIAEWVRRGYRNSMEYALEGRLQPEGLLLPPWMGSRPFHQSHQSNLVRKLPSHYRSLFPRVPDDLPYVWPV